MFTKLIILFVVLAVASAEDSWVLKSLLNSNRCGWFKKCTGSKVCAGEKHRQSCVQPLPLGSACDNGLHQPCKSSATCMNNICKVVVPLGQPCKKLDHVCEEGTKCNGRICIKHAKAGVGCLQLGVYCSHGLHCRGGKCV